ALLAYKVASSVVVGLPSSLILSAITYGYSTSFLAAFTGMTLIVMFMQMFTMALNLIAVTAGATLYSSGRKLLVALVLLAAGFVVWEVGGNPLDGEFV